MFKTLPISPLKILLPLAVALVAAVMPFAAASAQDIRISPPDPPRYYLEPEARIESAARLGSTVLAAWGTTVTGPNRARRRTEIWTQTIREGGAVGVPQRLTDTTARPGGVVAVLNLGSSFLVAWNDLRGTAPEVRARRVDSAGGAIGDELLVAVGTLKAEDLLWVMRTDSSTRLIWQGTMGAASGYFSISFDSAGMPIGPAATVEPANFDGVLVFDELPGAILERSSAKPSRFIHADGRVDHRTIPTGRLSRTFHVNADTSVVTVDSGGAGGYQLVFYASVFDTVAARRVSFRTMRFQSVLCGVVRDTAGVYRVIESGGYAGQGGYGQLLTSRALLPNDSLAQREDTLGWIFGFSVAQSVSFYNVGTVNSGGAISGDDNAVRFTYDVSSSHWDKRSEQDSWSRRDVYTTTVDGQGHVYTRDPRVQRLIAPDTRRRVRVERVTDSTTSSVLVDTAHIRVGVAIEPTPVNSAQRTPGIAIRDGRMLISWEQEAPVPTFGLAAFDAGVARSLATLVPLASPASTTASDRLSNTARLVSAEGRSCVVHISESSHNYGSYNGWHGGGNATAWVPSDTGWVRAHAVSILDGAPNAFEPGYDPTSGALMLAFAERKHHVVGLDALGNQTFRTDCSWLGSAGNMPVRVDDQTLWMASGDSVVPLVNGSPRTGLGFPARAPAGPVLLRALRGGRFIRCFPRDGVDTAGRMRSRAVLVELYDMSLHLLAVARIDAPDTRFDCSIAEPLHGGIVIAWGSSSGVHMTRLSNDFHVLTADMVVSHSRAEATRPVCAMFGRDAVVAWEDHRDGAPDIYATRVNVGTFDAPEPACGGSISITSVTPNPAHASIVATVHAAVATRASIDLVDVLGRTVRTLEPSALEVGENRVTVQTAGLVPGAYFLSLNVPDEYCGAARFVKAP